MKLFGFLLAVLFVPVAHASDLRYTAQVYELDSHRSKLLYNYRSESDPSGDGLIVHNRFTYPDGHLASHEEITFTKDGRFTLYTQEQAQLGATGSIEVKDGKATFKWKRDGKESSKTEDVGSDFIVGSQIPMELETHWSDLMKGDTLKRRLAVLDRLESIGFEFKKEGEETVDGKKAIVVRMKPTAFIIAAVVKPLHFYMSEDGKALLEIKGRTTVKRDKGNGKFGDLDAEVVYTKGTAPTPTPAAASNAQPTGGNSK